VPLLVVFVIPPAHPLDSKRLYEFMLGGLEELAEELAVLSIPFTIMSGHPVEVLTSFCKLHEVGEVVGDFNPLPFINRWKERVATAIVVRYTEVDAHNIIPSWVASDKEEFAAHTFRPKVHRTLPTYLTDFPSLTEPTTSFSGQVIEPDWPALRSDTSRNQAVEPVEWLQPGAQAAAVALRRFIDKRLDAYDTKRNDPNEDALSNLSPYLRHGHISAQRVALRVESATAPTAAKAAFLEELIVRRELTDNYCLYNPTPTKISGAHAWAQKTIAEHAKDEREYTYTFTEFETAKTHDELWNAMQLQMVTEGKMHGWCRMYWAKKILEWTPDVQTAIHTALDLNDKYELDGCDPNGVVGVMWSICGVHDRAWTERPVFGKIRYMNFNGAKRKFDVDAYIARYSKSM
jgi:deoxyribodipyrimidine photo-lyase